MKPTTGTIVRTLLLIIALINMALSVLGIVPEELVGDSQAYQIGSYIVTAVMSLIAGWKNNSWSADAILADEYLKALRGKGNGEDNDAAT